MSVLFVWRLSFVRRSFENRNQEDLRLLIEECIYKIEKLRIFFFSFFFLVFGFVLKKQSTVHSGGVAGGGSVAVAVGDGDR